MLLFLSLRREKRAMTDPTITTLMDAIRTAGFASTEVEREEYGKVRVRFREADPEVLANLLSVDEVMPWDLQPLGIRSTQGAVTPDATTFYLADEDALRLAVFLADAGGVASER